MTGTRETKPLYVREFEAWLLKHGFVQISETLHVDYYQRRLSGPHFGFEFYFERMWSISVELPGITTKLWDGRMVPCPYDANLVRAWLEELPNVPLEDEPSFLDIQAGPRWCMANLEKLHKALAQRGPVRTAQEFDNLRRNESLRKFPHLTARELGYNDEPS